ncbi:hypothetical protein ACSDR0_45440 [Streptosporangium sp. G11]|uniref:hypothetical protein n=1 Tax=Streptosporangium sp. G11 TaxID=3436926 RepID=UPI003EB7A422
MPRYRDKPRSAQQIVTAAGRRALRTVTWRTGSTVRASGSPGAVPTQHSRIW